MKKLIPLLMVGIIFSERNFTVASTDFYGPKSFIDILESNFIKTWTPAEISNIENRKHVVILDATKEYYISIDASSSPNIVVKATSDLNNGTGTYGDILRSMFQILDKNTSILNDDNVDLSYEYTIQPELFSYYSIDADASIGATTASELRVSDRGTMYIEENAAYLAFTFTASSNYTKIQATSRYKYDSSEFIVDENWSSSHWIKLNGTSISLTNIESDGTSFMIADASDLIDLSIEPGSDFNPKETPWQTNSFATYPDGVQTYEDIIDIKTSIDLYYHDQLGNTVSAETAASATLDLIEKLISEQGDSLRYSKEIYLEFRKNMLSHKYGSVTMFNAKHGENLVKYVYFTNAKDSDGNFHPFMVIASYNSTGGPQFLIDVTKPPGDGAEGTGYPEQTVTRNSYATMFLIKIPLKHYGDISNLSDNNLSNWDADMTTKFGSLADDWNDSNPNNQVSYDVYNYTSLSDIGIAIDGVRIYPAYNNQLVFTPMDAEITSTGIHVGRGMNYHYHADGHSFNGNGINLYNQSDYYNRTHPPIIGFAYDGIALYGKYESDYFEMEGYNLDIDEYGGHSHDEYSYHYHAFTKNVEQSKLNDPVSTSFTQHFLLVGAWKGVINSIPNFLQVTGSQFHSVDYAQYVGTSNCDGNGAEYDQCGKCGGDGNCDYLLNKNNLFPNQYKLSLPYPNPFNPITNIKYEIPKYTNVQVLIYDLTGKLIESLITGWQSPGQYSVYWNANKYSSGIYFVKLATKEYIKIQKLILIK